jgi:hypothetical protein
MWFDQRWRQGVEVQRQQLEEARGTTGSFVAHITKHVGWDLLNVVCQQEVLQRHGTGTKRSNSSHAIRQGHSIQPVHKSVEPLLLCCCLHGPKAGYHWL